MEITREISPELEPIEFPDYMDAGTVDAYIAENRPKLLASLTTRRQAQLARETDQDEALKAAMGQVPFMERVGSTVMSAPQSAMRQTGQTLRGLGEFLATTPIPRDPGEIAPEIVRENIRRAQRTPEQVEQEVEASPTRRLGGRMVAAAPEAFPTLPGVREDLPSQVASGVGSVAALLPAGLTGPMAPVVGGTMYGLSAGEESADDAARVIDERIAAALAQGDTATAADLERRKFDIRNTARTAGRVIGGATQGVLGVAGKIRIGKGTIGGIGSRVAERLVPRGASQLVQNRVRGAIEGGLTEATQESTEQLLGNAAAMAVYDPNRGLMDDVVESGIVGGVSGKVIGGVAGSRGGTRDPMPAARQASREVAPTLAPEDTESPDLTIEDVGELFGGKPEISPQTEPLAQFKGSAPVEDVVAPAETEVAVVEAPPAAAETPQTAMETTTPFAEVVLENDAEKYVRERGIASAIFRFQTLEYEALQEQTQPNPDREKIAAMLKEARDLRKATLPRQTVAEGGSPEYARPMESPATEAPSTTPTTEKPKRTRKPKRVSIEDTDAIEAAIPATPAPEPATPTQAQAAPATIPPDDAAMEAATAAAAATRQPAPVTRAPDAGIAERIAADTAMEQATARAGQTPAGQAPLNVAPEDGVVPKPGSSTPKIGEEGAPAPAKPVKGRKAKAPIAHAAEPAPKQAKEVAARQPKSNALAAQEIRTETPYVRGDYNSYVESALSPLVLPEDPTKQQQFFVGFANFIRFRLRRKYGGNLKESLERTNKDPETGRDRSFVQDEANKIAREAGGVIGGRVKIKLNEFLDSVEPGLRKVGATNEDIAKFRDKIDSTAGMVANLVAGASPRIGPEVLGFDLGITEKLWVTAHGLVRDAVQAIKPSLADPETIDGLVFEIMGGNAFTQTRKEQVRPLIAGTSKSAEPPAAQSAEVTTPEAAKQSLPPMAPKAQKAFLLEKIDEAIAGATEEEVPSQPNKEDQQAWVDADKKGPTPGQIALARNKARFGTVTIEVPGDGTFEVLNTKPALKAFKERAKRFPTGKASAPAPSTPSQNQSKPAAIGSNTKESFLSVADDFVYKDKDPGARGAIKNIISNGFQSAATDGKMMLVWNESLGGSLKEPAFFDTSGKPVKQKPDWRVPDWQSYIPKDLSPVIRGLDTERLFGVIQQAIGVQPRKVFNEKTKKPISHEPFVDIVKNPDGSLGVYAVGADEGEYVHNIQKGGKVISTVNADMLSKVIQASRRMGSKTIDIEKESEKDKLEPLIIKWPGATAVLMPVRRDDVAAGLKPILSGKPQSDLLERALNAAIKATDRSSATFSDPFLIAAVGLPVLNAALRLTRRVYLKTRNLVRAKQQGMRLIRRRLRTQPEADIPRIEEAYNRLVDGTPEQAPPDEIERFQAADGTTRQKSRGLFTGDVTVDSDEQWQSGADRWINQFNGNIRRAFEAAKSTDYATTGLNPAAQTYVFGRLLELSETAINAARNDVDAMRNLNLQKEIADAIRQNNAESGKALGAANLVQNRTLWMNPVLSYRNLIREAQKRLPFPDVVADEVRTWLQESGRRAVQEMRNAMTDADKVFAREFKTTAKDMRVVWRDVMTASAESQENIRRKILEELVKQPELAGMSREGFIDIANLLGRAWERERAKIFAAEFRKQVPLPSVKEDVRRKLFTAIPDILKWANLGLLDNEAFRNAVAPKFGVAKFNGETAKKLNVMAQQAQKVGGVNRNRILAEMYELMQTEGGVRWPDIVRDYWYAAVLGAVNTQVDNALGVINGALNTVMGVAMAKPEVRRLMGKAYVDGFSEAISDFWPILWRGDIGRAINYNANQPANALAAISKSGNIFAKALGVGKYVSRLMTALDQVNALSTDQAMKAWALGSRLPVEHVRRYLTPSEKVLASARLKAEAEGTPPNLMRKRVREIVQETIPVEVLISSKDIRELVTFTNQPKGIMGAVYRGVQEMEKKAPGFKLLSGTNFLRFAANYTNEILNYVAPVALWRYYQSAPTRTEGALGLKMGKEERQLILAKMALGTALGTFAAALFLGDDDDEKDRAIDITGSFKSLDPNKRKQLLSEGRQPYSIRFGNTYVSYRQLPFGGVLGSIGELRDRQLYNPEEWDQESIARKFADGAFAGTLIVRDSPAISSFTEFLGTANAYKYDMTETVEKSMPRYMARLAGSFVPRIAKEIDAWADPSIYKANTGHEFFLQQMPFFRRELGEGPVLNVLGEPVRVERYPWSRWIRERQEDKAWSTLGELASKGVFLPVPSVTVKVLEDGKRRPLTPSEQYRYQQNVGKAYRKFVEENSGRLLKMKPDEATDFIDRETDRIRQRIRAGA